MLIRLSLTKGFASGLLLITALIVFALAGPGHTEVMDRVAAFVDGEAITARELDELYRENLKISPDITRLDVLWTMVNRVLLLREARKLRIEGTSDEVILRDYIDLKVRAFIKVEEKDIVSHYEKSIGQFPGVGIDEIKDKIEAYLREKEVNNRLKRHMEKLKAKSYIKINEGALHLE